MPSEPFNHFSVEATLRSLTPEEVRVLELRLGLLNGNSLTIDEVATVLGISADAVRETEAQIFRKTGISVHTPGPMLDLHCPEPGCSMMISSECGHSISPEDCQAAAEELLWHFKMAHLPPELQPKVEETCLGSDQHRASL
jgi:DNA-binding CsgD family transcriptional regulator